MQRILSVTAPIFMLIGIGFVATRAQLVTREQIRGMGSFVITLALPALIIKGLAERPFHEIVNIEFLLAYAAGSLASFGLGFFVFHKRLKQDISSSAMAGLGMSASNSGFIGYPVAAMVVGPSAALGVAMAIMVETIVIIPMAQALAETGQHSGAPRRVVLLRTARRLTRSPLIIAIATGLALSLLGLRLPLIGTQVIDMLAGASAPVALFVIGGTLYGLKARGLMADITQIAIGKLIAHPIAIFLAFLLVPNMDPGLKTAGLVFASAPMLSIYPILGQRFGLEERCAAALLVSTVLSFATISLLLSLLN